MYNPPEFEIAGQKEIMDLLTAYPFGTLTSVSDNIISASHVPFLYEEGSPPSLICHVARANPHWRVLDGAEALVMFLGPQAYISPQWYGEDLSVPTWNYIAIHVRGRCQVIEQVSELQPIVQALLDRFESAAVPPWRTRLMQQPYQRMLKQVVGIRVEITEIEAKAKLGQNRSNAAREGAIMGLLQTGAPEDAQVAELMRDALKSPRPSR
jgi:transcriptional regulator